MSSDAMSGDADVTLLGREIVAAVLREPHGAFTMERLRIADVRGDEVLVRVVASGLCHTDVAVRDRVIPTPLPVVLGHEGSGVVEAVGENIRDLEPGDHVVLTYLSCGVCRECVTGMPACCGTLLALCFNGCRPDGSHALAGANGEVVHDRFFGQSSLGSHAVAHQRNIVKVARDLPLELLGPLGCGIMTGAGAVWNELKVAPGQSFAAFGAGAVGLSAVMAARIAGASTIIAVDKVASRLDLALELGATDTVLVGDGDLADQLSAILPLGIDHALETTGQEAVIRAAAQGLRQRGVLGLVAPTSTGDAPLDVRNLVGGCKTIKGIIEGGGAAQTLIPLMLDYFRQGRFPFDRLITRYPLAQINEAVRDSATGLAIKPVLIMDASVA